MGADFSRVRLDPLLDFAGLELKQGAVLLDGDANELMAILDRRLRALASDVLGRATVSATTPDAFKLGVAGSTLEIGKGRLYVDGLLAENHGLADLDKRLFDDLMAETVFTDKLTYETQPYLPAKVRPPLPTAGRHLVYLDVWNRELTYLERPELVEIAVGVETSSRLQTVWQVRVLDTDAGDNTDCATPDEDMPGWNAVIAPSTGVLTTGTFDAAPTTDPCELPPTGGFRGLENQLYRVEIQDPGQPGGNATFKWSRENASIGSRVASIISASELELDSLGRDDVLRFNTGDWVEIVDDAREFSQAAGEMRRITVTEATRRITFTPALPAPMLPPNFPNSDWPKQTNLRVRRWDQKGKVFRTDASGTPVQIGDLDAAGSTGVIKVPAAGTTILLEDGVTVSFDSTGPAGFRAGDWWAFAARTADASVELLDRAPPRGIHHHYARLGIWDVGAKSVTDCRHPWPPEGGGHDCACTACVTVEQHESGSFTIQDAVNKLRETGGTICLGPGQYVLRAAVTINQAKSIRIVGKGPATLLVAPAGAFAIQDSFAIAIEDLAIISLARDPTIDVSTCIGLGLTRLAIAALGTENAQLPAVVLRGLVAAAKLSENAIFAPVAIAGGGIKGTEGGAEFLLAAAVAIEENVLLCQRGAIAFADEVLHLLATRIAHNEILGCSDTAVAAQGLALPGASLAIDGNSFNINAHGIACAAAGLWIERNQLRNWSPGDHVGIGLIPGLDRRGTAVAHILANQIHGFGTAGIKVIAASQDLIIKLNAIDTCGAGIMLGGATDAAAVSIENNHIRNIGPATESDNGSVVGIEVIRAESATIAGNLVRAIGVAAVKSALRAGVLTFGVNRPRVSGNEIVEIAPAKGFVGTSAGIMLRAPQTQIEVNHNTVQRDLAPVADDSTGNWLALTTAEVNPRTPFGQAGEKVTIRLGDGRILALGADYAFVKASLAANDTEGARAGIIGNTLSARGPAPAVLVVAGQECLFNDNRVEASNKSIAVALESAIAIISTNRVRGGESSIRLANARAMTVLGNITTGNIIIPGGIANTPWAPLNVIG
ncbi:DUF6519 domain-containing protein [Bradyrhizobium sp.]|jgi:hypothetical protein|uniref:DUF6519 domain-containing protein n=1 Tax=Bradyrhizobium sp. TaxID=376 RepID=UPI002DDD1FFA|nr:DUF6519 domain-containing protein [Bradyrhizobium sp.]HEV2160405.1 DUF6519 domain-containing protein [Bradyrhizobium sp.]